MPPIDPRLREPLPAIHFGSYPASYPATARPQSPIQSLPMAPRSPVLPGVVLTPGKQRSFSQKDLNFSGGNVHTQSFSILNLSGGAGSPILSRSGFSNIIPKQAWLLGISLSASFSSNTTNAMEIAVGIDIGTEININTAGNLFLIFAHKNGSTTTTNIPVSKGGAMMFQFPFLPPINANNRLAGYVYNSAAVGEIVYGVVNFYYVFDID